MKKILYLSIFLPAIIFIYSGCKDQVTGTEIDNRTMPQSNISFSKDLQPVIEVKCATAGCHDDSERAGGLSLTSCSNAKADPAVVFPEHPGDSKIVWVVEGTISHPQLLKNFTSEQIRGLKKWIEEGANCN